MEQKYRIHFLTALSAVVIILLTTVSAIAWGVTSLIPYTVFILLFSGYLGYRLGRPFSPDMRFYLSLSAGMFCTAAAGFICAQIIQNRIPPAYIWQLSILSDSERFPDQPALLISGWVCLAVFVYLCFYFGRMCRNESRQAILLSLLLFLLIPVILAFSIFSIPVFFLHGKLLFDTVYTQLYQVCWIFIAGALLLLIRLFCFRRQLTWKRCVIELSVLAVFSVSLWGITYTYIVHRRDTVLKEIRNAGFLYEPAEYFSFMKGTENGAETVNDLIEQEKKIDGKKGTKLPIDGHQYWLQKDGRKSNELVTDQEKACEIARLQTPELKKFFKTIKSLEKYDNYQFVNSFGWETLLPHLNAIRSMMRKTAGRAAVAHYLKQPEKILSYLKDGIPLEKTLRQEPILISQLVRLAVVNILVETAVSLGPDSKEYLGDYRMLLEWVQSLQFKILGETIILAQCMNKDSSLYEIHDESPSDLFTILFPKWLRRPLELGHAILIIKKSAELEKEATHLITSPILKQPEKLFNDHVYFIFDLETTRYQILRKYRNGKGICETALALKIYRVEHGSYPETTRELVPEILKTLPLDPRTGQPYVYRRLNHHAFELEYYSRKNSEPAIFSSVPSY